MRQQAVAQLLAAERASVLERLAGRAAVAVYTRVGGRFTAHATGVGLVLLAFAPAETQQRYRHQRPGRTRYRPVQFPPGEVPATHAVQVPQALAPAVVAAARGISRSLRPLRSGSDSGD